MYLIPKDLDRSSLSQTNSVVQKSAKITKDHTRAAASGAPSINLWKRFLVFLGSSLPASACRAWQAALHGATLQSSQGGACEAVLRGAIAQLGERVVRNDEVRSSILLGSTTIQAAGQARLYIRTPPSGGVLLLGMRRCRRPQHLHRAALPVSEICDTRRCAPLLVGARGYPDGGRCTCVRVDAPDVRRCACVHVDAPDARRCTCVHVDARMHADTPGARRCMWVPRMHALVASVDRRRPITVIGATNASASSREARIRPGVRR